MWLRVWGALVAVLVGAPSVDCLVQDGTLMQVIQLSKPTCANIGETTYASVRTQCHHCARSDSQLPPASFPTPASPTASAGELPQHL